LHQAIRPEALLPDSQRRLESLFSKRIGDSEPDIYELEQLFLQFYGKFKCAFLVIDGLDEISDAEQRNFKSFLKTVQKMDSARIIAMTHVAMDMAKVLTPCMALQIKPEDLTDDITTFIQSQIDKHAPTVLYDCSPSILDIIKQKVVCDADGMSVVQLRALTYTREFTLIFLQGSCGLIYNSKLSWMPAKKMEPQTESLISLRNFHEVSQSSIVYYWKDLPSERTIEPKEQRSYSNGLSIAGGRLVSAN
jgi:hypothetical protein